MKTGEGGFVHRMMPPVDYNHGPIPAECYQTHDRREIVRLLEAVYTEPSRIRELAGSDDPVELMRAKIAAEMVAEIDAGTIWAYNISR